MMQLTPSAKSSFLAGIFLSVVAWATMFKLDTLAKFLKVGQWINQDAIFEWMNNNKTLTLIFTEFINYGVHGVTSTMATTFALGSTAFNAIAIYIGLPTHKLIMKRKRRKDLLHPSDKKFVMKEKKKAA